MNGDSQAAGFDIEIDGWVRAALSRGVRTFPDLLLALHGVYPPDALRSLMRLGQDLPDGRGASATPPTPTKPEGVWPVEHPLDFDWRFTQETVRQLLDRPCLNCAGDITFLGAPSLALEAAARGWLASTSLFDRNQATVAAFRASHPGVAAEAVDLVWGEPIGSSAAAVVVADPPWYPEHILAFLWASAQRTLPGGKVLISLPPEGTRPGILAERGAVLAEAEGFGLRASSIEPGVLSYRTPLFERNALAAAGFTAAVPWDWRRGDLAELVLTRKTTAPRPTPPGPAEEWDQEVVGAVRIHCKRHPGSGFHDPTLFAAATGGVLPSVSRRAAGRSAAEVWTSGNRVFKCKGTGVLLTILAAMRRGAAPREAVATSLNRDLLPIEIEMVQRAATQAGDLILVETAEIEGHGTGRDDGTRVPRLDEPR